MGDGIFDWVPELFIDLFMIILDEDDDDEDDEEEEGEEIPLLFKLPDELSEEIDEDEQVEDNATEFVLTNWWWLLLLLPFNIWLFDVLVFVFCEWLVTKQFIVRFL